MLSLVLLFDYSFWIHYMPIWSYRIRNIIYEKDVGLIQFSCYSFSLCFANCVIKNELRYGALCVLHLQWLFEIVKGIEGKIVMTNKRNRKCEIVQLQGQDQRLSECRLLPFSLFLYIVPAMCAPVGPQFEKYGSWLYMVSNWDLCMIYSLQNMSKLSACVILIFHLYF